MSSLRRRQSCFLDSDYRRRVVNLGGAKRSCMRRWGQDCSPELRLCRPDNREARCVDAHEQLVAGDDGKLVFVAGAAGSRATA